MAEFAPACPRTEDFEHFSVPVSHRVTGFPPPRQFAAGRVLWRQDDRAERVFLIERGLVKLIRAHPDGQGERIVGLRSVGWVLAAADVIADEPCVVTAVAAVPSRVAVLCATDFQRRLAGDPVFTRQIHRMHAHEICLGLHQLGEEAIPAGQRLEQLLRALVPTDRQSSLARSDLPLKQWEIAQLIGVRPQYLSVLLAQLGLDGSFRGHGGGRRPVESGHARPNGLTSQRQRSDR